MGYSPWGHKESDTTEATLHTHTHTHTHTHRLLQYMRVIHGGVIKNYKLRRKQSREMISRKVILEIILQGNTLLYKISLGFLPKFHFLRKLILTPNFLV